MGENDRMGAWKERLDLAFQWTNLLVLSKSDFSKPGTNTETLNT